MTPSVRSLCLVLFSAVALSACSGNPEERSRNHVASGDQRAAAGNLKEAIVEYRKAVQLAPMSPRARRKLAEAYLRNRDVANAVPEFVAVADLLPKDVDAQLAAAAVFQLAGYFSDARGRAEKALELDPKNAQAQILIGNALAELKDIDGAIAQIEGAIRTDPSKSVAYANLGGLKAGKGDAAAAEAAFKKAIFLDPKSVPARLALANLYWATDRRTEAESLVKEALEADPKNLLANRALSYLYLLSGRVAEAEGPLRVVAESRPGSDGWLALADYYIVTRKFDDAKALLEKTAQGPDAAGATSAKLRLASIGLWGGNRAEAYRLIDEVLAKEPKNAEALVGKAQLQMGDGKADEALKTSRAAVAADADSPQAHYVLGRVLTLQHQTDEAMAQHREALRANPRFAPASLELARLSLLIGKTKDAIGFAQEALQIDPGYADAHLLLAHAQIASGNPAGAERSLQLLVARAPESAAVQGELGRLLMAKGDAAGARAAFDRALKKDPADLNALDGIIAMDLRQKKTAEAKARIDAAVAANPAATPISLLAARTYVATGDDVAAERLLKQVLAADPNTLEAYIQLATMYVRQRKVDQAIAEFDKHAERQPKAIEPRTVAAILLHLKNDLKAAEARYSKILEIDPRAAVAANNLAQIYSDRDENLDIALQLAQTAKAGLPNSHEVDDTLGWLCYKKKLSSRAVASLKAAVAAQPENPVYLYHLGAAHAQNNEKTSARQALEKALRIKPDFAGADDARKVLSSIKN